jgi:1-pyrroline-5-carboxylate dehydrogenase
MLGSPPGLSSQITLEATEGDTDGPHGHNPSGTAGGLLQFCQCCYRPNRLDTITGYIEYARKRDDAKIVAGRSYDCSSGFFIDPTMIITTDPHFKTIEEEIFGPVL